jgi:hypothetical protein
MTSLIDILAGSVAKAALATRALAHRVLNLTGARQSRMVRDYPPESAMARHAAPPIE